MLAVAKSTLQGGSRIDVKQRLQNNPKAFDTSQHTKTAASKRQRPMCKTKTRSALQTDLERLKTGYLKKVIHSLDTLKP